MHSGNVCYGQRLHEHWYYNGWHDSQSPILTQLTYFLVTNAATFDLVHSRWCWCCWQCGRWCWSNCLVHGHWCWGSWSQLWSMMFKQLIWFSQSRSVFRVTNAATLDLVHSYRCRYSWLNSRSLTLKQSIWFMVTDAEEWYVWLKRLIWFNQISFVSVQSIVP